MLHRILVPLDGSAFAERALPYVIALARAGGGRIILLHAAPPLATVHRSEEERAATLELETMAGRVRASGVEVEWYVDQVYFDQLGRGIIDAARERSADLIAMSTHGQSGLARWIYGSVADEVLRRAELPILLVSAACERVWREARVHRILVPLDGSPLAEEALTPAGALAETLGASLLLVRVAELPGYFFGEGEAAPTLEHEARLADVRRYLSNLEDQLRRPGRAVETLADLGWPASIIATAARVRDADLIVMATHGRTGVARMVLGSVATGTLLRADVPLVLVRPAAVHGGDKAAT